jgi:hypothetical protein
MLERMSSNAKRRLPSESSRSKDLEAEGGLLGLGMDGSDGHKRVTSGDDFLLVGGSADTHEQMQDLVIRMNETLKTSGKRYSDLDRDEFAHLVKDSMS